MVAAETANGRRRQAQRARPAAAAARRHRRRRGGTRRLDRRQRSGHGRRPAARAAPAGSGGGAAGGSGGGAAADGRQRGQRRRDGGDRWRDGRQHGAAAGGGGAAGSSAGDGWRSAGPAAARAARRARGGTPAPNPALTGTATRPAAGGGDRLHDPQVLREGAAASVTGLTTDNWDPTAGVGDVATFTPTYTVAATGGTHTTVQAALTAAVGRGRHARIYIKVNPGTYRETICIKTAAAHHALRHRRDATTIIVNNANAGKMYIDAATAAGLEPLRRDQPARRRRQLRHLGQRRGGDLRARLPGQEPHLLQRLRGGGTSNIQAVALDDPGRQDRSSERPRARLPGHALREDRQRRQRSRASTSRTATSRATPTSSSAARRSCSTTARSSTSARAAAPPAAATSSRPAPTSATPTAC